MPTPESGSSPASAVSLSVAASHRERAPVLVETLGPLSPLALLSQGSVSEHTGPQPQASMLTRRTAKGLG